MTTDTSYPLDKPASERLTDWLTALVRNREYGKLAQLRRARAGTNARAEAGWRAEPNHEEQRAIFEQVAFLFAVYHRGRTAPDYGAGSLGSAARRIGGSAGRGPDDAGASRLMARIAASRRIPWPHLQHAVARLRSCEQPPPSWTQLADDLVRWHERKARIAYGWTVDFYEPPPAARAHSLDKDSTQKGSTQ
ncbi:type I-E CRISPR-associated protein Cse2/CasB [Streptomyces gamaensis]|uniref:Type I-E CRISPR-associated protein Cse2/CasB n=1 Tax=Streptomyces gamaensis TaxID=1763542 RepID=A0ABW0YUN1_9ACTN